MGEDSTGSTERSPASAMEISDEETFDRVVETEERVLVDFYAGWCAPCELMEPTIEALAAETDASVVRVDVEEIPYVAYLYGVDSIPTYLGLRDGDVVGRRVGLQEKDDLEQLLD